MEEPLVDVDRLLGGIMALAWDNDESAELTACYTLARQAREHCIKLLKIWEGVRFGKAGTE
jgi:hypothetical protein